MPRDNDFAILILSCDKYADLWAPFHKNFFRFFPVANYPVFLGSNLVPSDLPGVVSVLSGKDADWSTSCKRILEQIPQAKLFIILEDLLLASPAAEEGFEAALRYLFEKNAVHIKYWAQLPADEYSEDPWLGIHHRGAPYRATVCGFWDRKYLLNLLIEGENPWNFEILGSYRTSYSDGFYGLARPLCEFRNLVEKGCWIPESVEWAQREGISLDLEKRPMLKGGRQFLSRAKMLYFNLILRVPWHWRTRLMNKLRRALISY